MFLKSFKLKTNVPLRGSDAKKFRQRLEKEFPNAQIDILIPNKSNINVMKITTHANIQTNIYCIDKLPMFFENEEGQLVPTLYALWKSNDLLPYFTTVSPVIPKLLNGADLMLPGLIPIGTNMNMYGRYKKNQLVALNITSNMSAVGVGYLARSSEDLYMCGGKGVAIKMLHIMGDKLWGLEPSLVQQAPIVPPKKLTSDDFPELGTDRKPKVKVNDGSPELKSATLADIVSNSSEKKEDEISSNLKSLDLNDMTEAASEQNHLKNEEFSKEESQPESSLEEVTLEEKLKNAFLAALKNNGKSLQLPILTSNFYRNYVVPETEEQIDLKKTKYKKLSNFLSEMVSQGFIETKEETKGVEKIVEVKMDHPEILNFITDYKTTSQDDANKALFHTELTQMYVITDVTAPFFTKMSYKRGEAISEKDVKKVVRDYVKKFQLPFDDLSGKAVVLDDTLKEICDCPLASISSICNCLISEMTYSYQMNAATGGAATANKPVIQMSLATRAGNKKVTLVSNVECYGIVISEFVKQCKESAAASVSMVKLPHQKKENIQIQGNQIHLVYRLLTDTYRIPPKCITGLENARREKKPKK